MYAHIFATRRNGIKQFQLIITATPSLSDGCISSAYYTSKTDAKHAAKHINAKPWNYINIA